MPEDLPQPHDNLFRAVFGEPAEAAGLLRAHLPPAVAEGLDWSTLAVHESDFFPPELRASESNLLYSIKRRDSEERVWIYVVLEHQSTSRSRDRWMRLRVLQHCCRIWERDRRDYPDETELRPILPVVFYLGDGPWGHATEFSELLPAKVRAWPWLPRFEHLLIDHSETPLAGVRGAMKGRAAQLMMMAACRVARWPALRRALPLLAEVARRGGREQVRAFVLYALATQDEEMRRRFAKEFQRQVPGPEGDIMTYVEEIKQQGRQEGRVAGIEEGRVAGLREGRQEGRVEGRMEEQVRTIESLLRAGAPWPLIKSATGVDEAGLRALKQRLAASTSPNGGDDTA